VIVNLSVFHFQLNWVIAFCAKGFDDCICVEGSGDAEHVPGAVGVIGFSIRTDFEVRGYPRERVRHADRQGLYIKEEGVAVVEFFVIFAGFFNADVEVMCGFVCAGRDGHVREVAVDEVADLPEEGVIHVHSVFCVSLIPGAIGIVIAEVNAKVHAGFERHQDRNPTRNDFDSVFCWNALIGQSQVCTAFTIRF